MIQKGNATGIAFPRGSNKADLYGLYRLPNPNIDWFPSESC